MLTQIESKGQLRQILQFSDVKKYPKLGPMAYFLALPQLQTLRGGTLSLWALF
jgi:hypothetical protein